MERATHMKVLESQWQRLPEKTLRRLQAQKLQRFLRTVVLPFSAHYKKVFRDLGLTADSIQSLEDLHKIPFACKTDLLATPEQPQKFKDCLVVPDPKVLSRRPGTICN